MNKGIFQTFLLKKSRQEKSLAVLIDPDKYGRDELNHLIPFAEKAGVDYFFAGGSVLLKNTFDFCISYLKQNSKIPVVLFPGSHFQISNQADAILLLSLISGRNPELLIGQHVLAAPDLKRSGLEIMPTGYMLIDGGALTSVNYVSQTLPIPSDKNDIAVSTALAGEMLGLKLIYLEAGSGAKKPVSVSMISAVREKIQAPLIVGGGIRDAEQAYLSSKAGADVVVIGNVFEEDASRTFEIASAIHQAGKIIA